MQIEINQDGTAYCNICNKDKPVEGFVEGMIHWPTREEPAEYGQICKDCQDMEKHYWDEEAELMMTVDD